VNERVGALLGWRGAGLGWCNWVIMYLQFVVELGDGLPSLDRVPRTEELRSSDRRGRELWGLQSRVHDKILRLPEAIFSLTHRFSGVPASYEALATALAVSSRGRGRKPVPRNR
jgi:hypothetical protein